MLLEITTVNHNKQIVKIFIFADILSSDNL